MNIVDYIPNGRKNAISRNALRIVTGLSDRKIRAEIARARREKIIINTQDGKGYYILPTEKEIDEKGNIVGEKILFSDEIEKAELAHFVKQEERRLKSIGWSLKAARDALKSVGL